MTALEAFQGTVRAGGGGARFFSLGRSRDNEGRKLVMSERDAFDGILASRRLLH